MRRVFRLAKVCLLMGLAVATVHETTWGQSQALIPGTGSRIAEVGDDFEDPDWSYDYQLPKVFNNLETTLSNNYPLGRSANGRWYEGAKRGQPDVVRRVPTPSGGLPGSTGAIAIRSLKTGGQNPSYQQQQDDLIGNVMDRIGKIPVTQAPSVVTRVWLPPLDEWEHRSGCHFAFRVALEQNVSPTRSRFRQISSGSDDGVYWPGFFLDRQIQTRPGQFEPVSDRVNFWMKASADSRRLDGPEVTQFGWWTLGISVTPDGQVHYFAKPGVQDLTAADHVASAFPFGYRASRFRSFFFNVCNGDDGRTWSTEFIIDDTAVFIAK
ncbi:MAG TPA: hypothetical protein PKD54_02540 [Pirellulaceae bacterium]|nr:hypothetical protein [Pirellulaceae bacterium]